VEVHGEAPLTVRRLLEEEAFQGQAVAWEAKMCTCVCV
jgi:hypothetical protein